VEGLIMQRLLLPLVLLCAAAAAGWFYFGPGREIATEAQAADDGTPAVAVEAAEVEVTDVATEIAAVGSLQANESVTIAPKISGRVAEILFRDGQAITRGDVLVRLEDNVLRAELDQARADLTLARANFERADTLARQGTGTQRAKDEAVAALRSAEARVALSEAQLADATIVAPFDGFVGLRSISVGDYLSAGDRIVDLAQIDPVKVDFKVPELYLTQIKLDQPIVVTVDALPGSTFEGRIYAIAPQVDINGRALQVRAVIPNPDLQLRPGLFTRIRITVDVRTNSLVVPEAALVPQGDKRLVFRVVDGKAVSTEVRIGKRERGKVEILSGLQPGDMVVTAGQMKLSDGTPVEIIGPETGAQS